MSVNSQNIVGLVGWSDSSVEVPHCQVGGGCGVVGEVVVVDRLRDWQVTD